MSGHPSTYEPKYAATKWIDRRLPIIRLGADFMTFPSPRNLNYWYTFGGRDVPFGWMLQPMHAVGASMFFLAVYMHMFRGLYYGSYKAPRELLWIIGCVIYLVMMDCYYGLLWCRTCRWRKPSAVVVGGLCR